MITTSEVIHIPPIISINTCCFIKSVDIIINIDIIVMNNLKYLFKFLWRQNQIPIPVISIATFYFSYFMIPGFQDIQSKMPSPKVIYSSNSSKAMSARNFDECHDNDTFLFFILAMQQFLSLSHNFLQNLLTALSLTHQTCNLPCHHCAV